MGFNSKGEQVIPDDGDIIGQDVDEGSIYDDFNTDDEIKDEDIAVEDEAKNDDDASDDNDDNIDNSTTSNDAPKRENRLEKRINEISIQRSATEAKNAELQKRLYELEKNQVLSEVSRTSNDITSQIKEAEERKEIYMEDNNYSAVTQIDKDLHDLRVKHSDNEYRKSQVEKAEFVPDTPIQEAQEIPEIQQKWIEDNKWFNKIPGKTAYANEVYDEMIEDGYDPSDPNLYDELNERINNISKAKYGKNNKPRNEQAPTPGNSEVGDGPTGSQRKSALTNADLAKMKKWGIDTTSKEARAEWLRNKRRAEAEYN